MCFSHKRTMVMPSGGSTSCKIIKAQLIAQQTSRLMPTSLRLSWHNVSAYPAGALLDRDPLAFCHYWLYVGCCSTIYVQINVSGNQSLMAFSRQDCGSTDAQSRSYSGSKLPSTICSAAHCWQVPSFHSLIYPLLCPHLSSTCQFSTVPYFFSP